MNFSVAENSKDHKQNILKWKELKKRLRETKKIDHELQNPIENEKEKWFCIFKVIVEGILLCAKNNLTLRGSSDKIGYPNLCPNHILQHSLVDVHVVEFSPMMITFFG